MCMLPQAARLEQQQQRDQDEQQQQLEVPAGKIVLTMKPVPVSEAACRTLLLAAGYGPKEGVATPVLWCCAILRPPVMPPRRHV